MTSATKWIGALVLTVGLCLSSTSAAAQTVTRTDKVEDAPRGIDIATARYSHTDEAVSVKATIPRLQRSGTASLSITRFKVFEAGYVVEIVKRQGKPATTRLLYFDHVDAKRRSCEGVRGQWGRTSVRLTVPTACLRGHRAPKLFVQFGASNGQRVDRAPAVRRLTRS